jgi:hypothetical protein
MRIEGSVLALVETASVPHKNILFYIFALISFVFPQFPALILKSRCGWPLDETGLIF